MGSKKPDETPKERVWYTTPKGEFVYPLGDDKYEIWTANGPVVVTRVREGGE